MTYLIMRCEEVFCLSLCLVMPALLRVRRAKRHHHYPFTGRHTVIQNEGSPLALTGVRKGGLLGSWKERQLKTICCEAWFEYSLNFYIVLNVTQMQISIDDIFFWACYVHLFLVYFSFFFVWMEKQAQLNRHEMILKKCFLHVYSGSFFFPCSNFLFLWLLSVHFEWFACDALQKLQGFGESTSFCSLWVSGRCHP